ncbi:MAG: CRISPR-associated helicase Cas3', partial [Sideroxydans sp.]|nr:CRISPR-associated helicase Cas3' [Sideroxydans sp.]
QRSDLLKALQGREAIRPYAIRHDTLGARLWLWFVDQSPQSLGLGHGARRYRQRLAPWVQAVTGHHGQPPGAMAGSLTAHFDQADLDAAAEFISEMQRLLLPRDVLSAILALDAEQHEEAARHLSWWFAGVAVLSDWLGSNTDYFSYRSEPLSLDGYWSQALVSAEKALAASGVLPGTPAVGRGVQDLFTPQRIQKLTPLQRWAQDAALATQPQLVLLEDVTGAGKTEAALTLAYRLMAGTDSDNSDAAASGIFFALPTMATANAMFERVSSMANRMFDAAQQPSCVLAHGQRHLSQTFRSTVLPATHGEGDAAQLDETAGARCAAWLADHNKKALLADVGVGTIDQALLAVLHARHQSLRLLGLFGKVLIVDEVHACDAYMLELLERLLRFHAAAWGSAILLSATLPRAMKQSLANAFAAGAGWAAPTLESQAYPLATRIHRRFAAPQDETHVQTRLEVRRHVKVVYLDQRDQVEARIKTELAAGRCVCWIRNTVAEAVAAWQRLSPALPEGHCTLFHARFAMGDRLQIEQDVLDRFGPVSSAAPLRAGQLVIATQVVEQSLDVDFDLLVSDLAPIDRLIQRAGRLQRHVRDERGNLCSGDDRRGGAEMVVFGPGWSESPGAMWFKAFSAGSAAVYPHHGQSWLTARYLRDAGGFAMPEDARNLIEGVFGDQAEYPAGLQHNAERAEGVDWAQTNFAAAAALDYETGYSRQGGDWHSDDETLAVGALDDWQTPASTRAGDATTTVRLAKWQHGVIVPWCGQGDDAWDMSSLRVAKRLIAESLEPVDRSAEWQRALETMPDSGRWSVLLVLAPLGDGCWHGSALDPDQRSRRWAYDSRSGLQASAI